MLDVKKDITRTARFGYKTKKEPTKIIYFDCVSVVCRDGIITVKQIDGDKTFISSELSFFCFVHF